MIDQPLTPCKTPPSYFNHLSIPFLPLTLTQRGVASFYVSEDGLALTLILWGSRSSEGNSSLILHTNESIYILEGLIIQWEEWTRPVSLPWVLPGGQLHHLPLPLPLPSYSTPHPPPPPLGEALSPLFTQWHTPSPPCVGPCILHLQGVHFIKKM